MAKTKYTYNITDFSNNKADAGKLYNTILESPDFTCMVDSINISADDVDIWFRASITPAEWATLSGIVAVHDGEEYTEEKPTIDQGMYGKNTAGSWVPMQFSSEGRILVDVQTTAGQHGNDSHTSEFITVSGVTFEALNTNGDIGIGVNQVAQGNHLHDDRYYTETEIDNFGFITTISGGAHNELTNLDYASSGHTGFSPTTHTHAESDITDLDKYTQTEVDTISGTLQTQIDGKSDIGHTHPSTDITDWNEAVDDRVSNLLVAGDNISLTYDDGANTLTISGSGGGEGGGTFGSEYHYAESDGTSYTSGDNYQQKLRLTMSSLPSGTYRIGWSFEWMQSRGGDQWHGRVQINDTTTIMQMDPEPGDDDYWYPAAGFKHIALSGVNNIDLDFHADTGDSGGGAAYIRRARLELWRVS